MADETRAPIIAIDPGIRSPGAAFLVEGIVVAAARIKVPRGLHECKSNGHRAREVGKLIAEQCRAWAKQTWGFRLCDVVYEWPQIYRATKSKGNPNDLLKTLATGASAVAELGGIVRSVTSPTPGEWAGQTKKATKGDPWDSERGRMVARRLSPNERAVVPDSHDAIDAVALGLWKAGRFDAIRVNFGATPG